jgi:DNA-binding response OmpR family regulator
MRDRSEHRLLIVDDEPTILFAMREYFGAIGYEVDCAGTLPDATAFLSRHEYSAVIADLCLSGIESREGLEVIDLARARSERTRIMLLSAYVSNELEFDAVSRGASVVMRKPQPMAHIARSLSIGPEASS